MTNDDLKMAKKQPQRHQQKKGIIEQALQICCVPSNDLNKRENKYFTKFVKTMIGDFDSSNPQHESDL